MNPIIKPSLVVGLVGVTLAGALSGGAVVDHESLGRMGSALVESMRARTDPQEQIAAARAAVVAIHAGVALDEQWLRQWWREEGGNKNASS